VSVASAHAKINLALVVGPARADGKHELATVLQRVALADGIELEAAEELSVAGFEGDTLVRGALEALAVAAGVEPRWKVTIEKRIPVAAGLGGGSSDAAATLRLANEILPRPLPGDELHRIAATLGADVPFFLEPGAKLGRGDGTELDPLELPLDYHVLLLLPRGAAKESTGSVYAAFDERGGAAGFEQRVSALEDALRRADLARLPRNDLASSPAATTLEVLGAFRADVSGAGPVVYGLFESRETAESAAREAESLGRAWLTEPVT
jgi:4-diphosphocytidyl-2-C-methyl-D-erythritol kinase